VSSVKPQAVSQKVLPLVRKLTADANALNHIVWAADQCCIGPFKGQAAPHAFHRQGRKTL